MGCAIAAAAMLTGRSYREVAEHPWGGDPAVVRYPARLQRLLEVLTRTPWRLVRPSPEVTVADLDLPDWPVPVFVHDHRHGQWVVADRGAIHDPEYRTSLALAVYPRRLWRVSDILEPADRPRVHVRSRKCDRAALLRQILATLRRNPSTL
jgi:hypothetical protein